MRPAASRAPLWWHSHHEQPLHGPPHPNPLPRRRGRGSAALAPLFPDPFAPTLFPQAGERAFSARPAPSVLPLPTGAFPLPLPTGERAGVRGQGELRQLSSRPPHPNPLPRRRGRGSPEFDPLFPDPFAPTLFPQAGERAFSARPAPSVLPLPTGAFPLPLPTGERAGVRGQGELRQLSSRPPHPNPLPRRRGRGSAALAPLFPDPFAPTLFPQAGDRAFSARPAPSVLPLPTGAFPLPLPTGERAGVRGQGELRQLSSRPPHPNPLPRKRGRGSAALAALFPDPFAPTLFPQAGDRAFSARPAPSVLPLPTGAFPLPLPTGERVGVRGRGELRSPLEQQPIFTSGRPGTVGPAC
ncbi:MAG: hypothetical protein KatS3mg102_2235 [Planctomycetota bacterium]|nr:MAG: hypothetical protein KatS3mg102_2235 [Planctomycetota bacterium]